MHISERFSQLGALAGYFRSDITVVCKAMEFGQFPLDSHDCYFLLTSCRYPGRNMLQALHSFPSTSWLRPEENDPAGNIFLREGEPENAALQCGHFRAASIQANLQRLF